MASIQTNIGANVALLNTSAAGMNLNTEIARLSSGFRINRAGDDAAGLAIANKLRGQAQSLTAASRNASQANSMLQIADGATNTISTILDRMKELATESNSDSIGSQRGKLDAEFQQLSAEIDRISATTQYQGSGLINGTFGATVDTASTSGHSTVLAVASVGPIQTNGAAADTYTITANTTTHKLTMTNSAGTLSQTISNAGGAQTLDFSAFGLSISTGNAYVQDAAIGNVVVSGSGGKFMVSSSGNYAGNDLISLNSINLTTSALGLTGLNLNTAASAQATLTALDTATDNVNTAIGSIGAAESRIGFAQTNVDTITQNTTAAESTIRDADMAAETTAFTKYNILQQAGMAMIAQANQSASQVLSLLH
ncbi:MAG TPA: flagellin [Gemmatimonadales bacterium]|jgi:flagellin|nr:flagellin [Gemmatimonadales bacterium]